MIKYDIEADWITNMMCNYACEYCFARSDKELEGVLTLSAAEYADFFDKTGKVWMLRMTGGEPFVHTKIVGIMKAVTKNHYISINTNGTQTRNMLTFTQVIDPTKVEAVHIGVHILERNRLKGWKSLIENTNMLRAASFQVFASLVMEPSIIKTWGAQYRWYKEYTGCPLVPKLMRDNKYPKSYTEEERGLISSYINQVMVDFPDLEYKPYTLNPVMDRMYLRGYPDFQGHNCRAGKDTVRIDEKGTIWRCEYKEKLGSLITGELNLHKEAYPCNETYCPYYCLKYSSLTNISGVQER